MGFCHMKPIAFALLLSSSAFAAEVYKCHTSDGHLSLSDKPCGPLVIIAEAPRTGANMGAPSIGYKPLMPTKTPDAIASQTTIIVQQAPIDTPLAVEVVDQRGWLSGESRRQESIARAKSRRQ